MEASETMFEEREEVMVSPTGNTNPTRRIAHFLNPTVPSIKGKGTVPKLPSVSLSSSSLPPAFEPEKWPLKVNFKGWRKPKPNWKLWVDHLESRYQTVWKKAGIYAAILSSRCTIRKDDDFIFGIAEKWFPETNTFNFSWGEATITLEDVMVLGGYSILGSPVSSCHVESREFKEIEGKLEEARREIGKGRPSLVLQSQWMKNFMYSGSEIEHEAFLTLWLARYVFPDSEIVVKPHFFPIAINLARGIRVAIAPAVLASIYRDLSLLKATIVATTEFETGEDVLAVTLWSPFQLIQIWGWERFPEFQPEPNCINNGDPRSALWDNVKGTEIENVRLALDSAGNSFCWRPYAVRVNSWQFLEFTFYKEKEGSGDLASNEDLSYGLCLRVSELVGLDCIEQYLPNRVAMQFGLDQDVPAHVARSNETTKLAWSNYIRPFSNHKFYVPSQFFKPAVTIQYMEWRKSIRKDVIKDLNKGVARRKRSVRKRSKQVPWISVAKKGDNNLDIPFGFSPSSNRMEEEYSVEEVKPTLEQLLGDCRKENSLAIKPSTSSDIAAPAQHLSITKTGSGTLREIELLKKPEDKTMYVNTELRVSLRALEGATDSKSVTPAYGNGSINRNVGANNASNFQIQALKLDARIARLERGVPKLKEAKFGTSF